MDNAVRVSSVFVKAEIKMPDNPIITDRLFQTSCPTCSKSQLLSESKVYVKDDETLYNCKNGCQVILKVRKFVDDGTTRKGYRIKEYVIYNLNDIFVMTGSPKNLLIPKVSDSFD